MTGSPYYHVSDTPLAAALATFGIPLVQNLPMTEIADTETGRSDYQFLFLPQGSVRKETTEQLIAAWQSPEKFHVEQLEWMRLAYRARKYLVNVIHGTHWPHPKGIQQFEESRDKMLTPNLRDAVLYVANYQLLGGFYRPVFQFANGPECRAILDMALREHGSSAPQWQHKLLFNFEELLKIVKSSSTLLRFTNGAKTMLLSADANAKLEDKFHRRFNE